MSDSQAQDMSSIPDNQSAQPQTTTIPTINDTASLSQSVRVFLEPVNDDEFHLTEQERQDRATSRIIQAQQDSVNFDSTHSAFPQLRVTGSRPVQTVATINNDEEQTSIDPALKAFIEADLERLREEAERDTLARQQRGNFDPDLDYSESEDESDLDDADDDTYNEPVLQDPKPNSRKRVASSNAAPRKKGKPGRPKGSKNKKKATQSESSLDVHGLIGAAGSTVYEDAAATAHLENQPEVDSETRGRGKVLAALLRSIPYDDRDIARGDKDKLEQAIKDINNGGQAVVPRENGWLLRGMKTPLKHYQALALDFMRRQELKKTQPKGGILADCMGLGKTVEMIANIVKGIQDYRAERLEVKRHNRATGSKDKLPPRPTLIVVPASLLHQWNMELQKHAHIIESEAKKDSENKDFWNWCVRGLLNYREIKNMKPQKQIAELEKHDIVLVSYHTVMASYRVKDPPPALLTDEEKKQWHKQKRFSTAGILHRVQWQRVVLDEAHTIKNHLSSTSIACRILQANHYWAMSGTPVLNSLSELYPYLKFIREPLAQSIRAFNQNFCIPGDNTCKARLLTLLSSCFLRRTMSTTMFGRKLLPLSKPTAPRTMKLEMNRVEKHVYHMIESHYRAEINKMLATSKAEGNKMRGKVYAQIYTRMLRLRQAAGHFFLLHDVIPQIMTLGSLEQLSKELKKEEVDAETESMKLACALMARDKHTGPEDERHEVPYPNAALDELRELVPDVGEGVFGEHNINYAKYFKEFTTGERFVAVKNQTTCVLCHSRPDDAHVTDCGHVYCYGCLDDLLRRAARTGRPAAKCHNCQAEVVGAKRCVDPASQRDQSSTSPVPDVLTEMDAVIEKDEQARGKHFNKWLRGIKGPIAPSSKTMMMKSVVQEWIAEDSDVKIIIYSQFVNMLKILQRVCECEEWTFEHYNGKMSLAARADAIDSFMDPNGGVRILLASLKCAGLGLNLTAASKVLLMDSWFNDSVEEQAFCRVFRQGQTKEASITRLVVDDSIDTYLEAMKARKTEAIKTVVGKDGQVRIKPTLEELIEMFGEQKAPNTGRQGFAMDSTNVNDERLPHDESDREDDHQEA